MEKAKAFAFGLWQRRLESGRFKISPEHTDEAIMPTVQQLNWLLDDFDLWRNRPPHVLHPQFVV
ncbi:transposase [Pseudomonas yamanorum]|nr:transposase [Pseudomonas yamanorum]